MGKNKKKKPAAGNADGVVIKNPEPIPRSTPTEKKKATKPTAFKIDMQMPGYHGEFKMVTFVDGVGTFSMDIFRAKKANWFDRKTGEQIKGVPFNEYLKMWKERGAIVTPIKKKD